MSTDTQEVAGSPAPVVLADTPSEAQNTPPVTAAGGDGGTQEQVQDKTPKTFTQSEVDALVQKRLLKEQRRLNKQMQERFAQERSAQPAPQRQQFQDDEAFTQAQIEHLAEQKAQQKLAERQKAEQSERMAETFMEKAEKAIERFPDFQAVVGNPSLQINESMAEFIADSDLGPDVAYFLGKNPAKAAQIAQMSPVKAAIALKGIEAELAAKPAAPKPSAAPAPIKPVGASSASTKSPAQMTDAEYSKWRKSGKR